MVFDRCWGVLRLLFLINSPTTKNLHGTIAESNDIHFVKAAGLKHARHSQRLHTNFCDPASQSIEIFRMNEFIVDAKTTGIGRAIRLYSLPEECEFFSSRWPNFAIQSQSCCGSASETLLVPVANDLLL